MFENKEFTPHSIESEIDDFKKQPGNGINLEILSEAVNDKKLSAEQLTELNKFFVIGYNKAMDNCFPRNAFDNLRGQNMLADYIPPQAELDLDKEWDGIRNSLKISSPTDNMTTMDIYQHFKNFELKDFPDYEGIVQRMSSYISESIRRAHEDNDPARLQKLIPAFKLLAYLHKVREQLHYNCPSEFDDMVFFGVDEEKMEFRYLKRNELKEKLTRKF